MTKIIDQKWCAVGSMVENENGDVADVCSCNPSNFGQEHMNRTYGENCDIANFIAKAPLTARQRDLLLEALKEIKAAYYKAKVNNDQIDSITISNFGFSAGQIAQEALAACGVK